MLYYISISYDSGIPTILAISAYKEGINDENRDDEFKRSVN